MIDLIKLKYVIIVAIAGIAPGLSVQAQDSVCPDYSHYQGILNEGKKQADKLRPLPSYSARRLYIQYPEGWNELRDILLEASNKVVPKEMLENAGKLVDEGNTRPLLDFLGCLYSDSSELSMDNCFRLKECVSILDLVIKKISNQKDADANLSKALKLKQIFEHRIMKIECLDMADKLSETGWKLEKHGAPDESIKMYSSVVEIRKKNLKPDDRLIAGALVNLARAEVQASKNINAARHFEQAIAIYKKSKVPDDTEYRCALENYAGFLKQIDEPEKAAAIYDVLRKL